ncbi:InlB B-repeat-containing protein [Candidatus Saccharibacteria bacterium]|nr:InlB B-repeat-containing protein [Candidatus Saccharibacteria bacterium]
MKKTIKILCISIFSLFNLVFANQAVFAEDSLSIAISPSAASMEATADVFATTSQTLTVSTTNLAGYTVSIAATGSSNALIHQLNPNLSIPTFTLPTGATSIPAGSTGYGYGFSVDGGANYFSIPEPGFSQKIFETSSAGENEHNLTYGTLVSPEQPSGTYSNTLIIQAVVNLAPCPENNICYYGNDDDGTGTMENQLASSSTDITLIPSNFSRPGYGFVGWNTEIDGSGTNYGPNATITTGDLTAEGLQLYAKWAPSAGNLQDWAGCKNLNIGDVTALTDVRDGETYAVAKYVDGQCWMMENLRLDLSNPNLEISNLNTNQPTDSFISAINNGHPASTNDFCVNNNANCINRVLHNTNNTNRDLTASYDANNTSSSWYSYGNYYNWYTATAGNGTYDFSVTGAAVSGDICPANWRIPSGYSDNGELSRLDVLLGGNGKNKAPGSAGALAGSIRWRTYPLNFVYSGEQRGETAGNRAISSNYNTANTYSAERSSNLWIKADSIYMNSNNTLKVRGQTVRCVFSEEYHANGNIHYNANGGAGTMADEVDVDFGVALAANNEFTKQHATFLNWNTASDGSGIVVTEGGMVSEAAEYMGLGDGDTLTLYAIWRSEYNLSYDGNGATAGSMSSADVESLSIGKLPLVASNFSRNGYGFIGWSLDANAGTKFINGNSVTIYGPNETINVDNAFLAHADANNHIDLYAVWLPEDTTYTMQSFNSAACNAINSGGMIALRDTRDNNTYSVAKLEDGNCWMTENLRLNPAAITFDSNNTNLPTSNFVTMAASSSTSNVLCKTNTSDCIDTVKYNTNTINRNLPASHNNNSVNSSWYGYGVMYNWYTASAGNGTFSMTSGNVAGDICPTGWRLPTGGTSGEYVTLNNLANNASTKVDTGLVKFPDNFIYAGDYNYNTPNGRHSYGRYWSATPNGANNAYRLGVTASGATPTGSWNKWDAFAVRCIVK